MRLGPQSPIWVICHRSQNGHFVFPPISDLNHLGLCILFLNVLDRRPLKYAFPQLEVCFHSVSVDFNMDSIHLMCDKFLSAELH